MFQHLFAEMNKMLQEIVTDFPTSEGARRSDLLCKYNMLHRLSDNVMDEWLAFSEKLSEFREHADFSAQPDPEPAADPGPELAMDSFVRGQGYYKLQMYRKCIDLFSEVIAQHPDSLAGRLYLAMAHLQEGEKDAAWGHLFHMLALIRESKLKAMVYNALGCIKASQERYGEAQELFSLSLLHDPHLPEPSLNLEVCRNRGGQLQFGNELVSML
ncbi:tetratricopeptide repeat protein [Paenibacillus sp. NFR01]|uniref:tetratricopeptide repeat protein n=1 Tax=Paenibacillus sp. NFR01 TaxID=1566279 RepID=UPI0008CC7F07|nr:tetratricopeptide repeat protein [Paenibacillus sp. NFR01]SET51232.1 hypothetical protein SAMN03159358_1892 [Paenibacillus sp. NFR01]